MSAAARAGGKGVGCRRRFWLRVTFKPLEDETAVANLVVRTKVFEKCAGENGNRLTLVTPQPATIETFAR